MITQIKQLIGKNYNLQIKSITKTKGGWTSLAYKIETSTGNYFAKVYEKNRPNTEKFTSNLEKFSLITANLKIENIIKPIANNQNNFVTENNEFKIILYNYIDGEIIGDNSLNGEEIEIIFQTLELLHNSISYLEFPHNFPKENFKNENVEKLKKYFRNLKILPKNVGDLLEKNHEKLSLVLEKIDKIAKDYKNKNLEFVLCHTDLHNFNLMKSKNGILYLLDFDSLKLSPKENDLFILDERVLKKYDNIDYSLLNYYKITRIIDDIVEEIEEIENCDDLKIRSKHFESLVEHISLLDLKAKNI